MELKIFIYWLILLIVFRIIAYIEYSMDNAVIYFKYYDGFLSGIYFFYISFRSDLHTDMVTITI